MRVLHPPRPDGSLVIESPFGPYHVTEDDPLFANASAAYAALIADGVELPPEPEPPPIVIPPAPQPTRAELLALLQQVQAQIQALPEEEP